MANLIYTVEASVTVSGSTYNVSDTITVDSVDQVDKRTVLLPADTPTLILKQDAAVANGQFINWKYLSFNNKGTTDLKVTFAVAGDTVDFALPSETLMVIPYASININVAGAGKIDEVYVEADTEDGVLEYFIAE